VEGLRDLVLGLREAFAPPDKLSGWLAKYGSKSAVAGFEKGGTLPEAPKEKWVSAGCVVLPSLHPDDLNFVYVIKPSNNYGPWSFPKGRIDQGETATQAARREVQEEAGLVVSILPGGYLGKGVGRFSITHYYVAVQVGGSPGPQDHEVEEVRLVSFEQAWKLFKSSGNNRDVDILQKAWKFTERFRKRSADRSLGDMEPVAQGKRSGWKPPNPAAKSVAKPFSKK
jgi:8-oxo-dGTP pyrophosphatase MutT (NUDIX family)